MWLQAKHAHACPQYSHASVGLPQLMKAVRILLVECEGGALHNDKLTGNKELLLPLGGLCIKLNELYCQV